MTRNNQKDNIADLRRIGDKVLRDLSPADRAVAEKLHQQQGGRIGREAGASDTRGGIGSISPGDLSLIGSAVRSTVEQSRNAKQIYQVLPDLKLAREIIVSATLAPTTLVGASLTWGVDHPALPGEFVAAAIEFLRSQMNGVHRIEQSLLRDMVDLPAWELGALPFVVIPESSVDDLINGNYSDSSESFTESAKRIDLQRRLSPKRSYLLGDVDRSDESRWEAGHESIGSKKAADKVEEKVYTLEDALESLTTPAQRTGGVSKVRTSPVIDGLGITLTDNLEVLKVPATLDVISSIQDRSLSEAMESNSGRAKAKAPSYSDVVKAFYRNRKAKCDIAVTVPTAGQSARPTVGHPLVIVAKPESLIPITVPGNPKKHIRYIAVLDENGNFLSAASRENYYGQLSRQFSESKSAGSSSMTAQVLGALSMQTPGAAGYSSSFIDQSLTSYTRHLEKEVITKLKSLMMGGEVSFDNRPETMAMLLSRSLANRNTTFLCIPAEMVTYVAYEYNDNGVGRTIIEDTMVIGACRAAVLFSTVINSMRQAAGQSNIQITLSPDDTDSATTVMQMLARYDAVNRRGYGLNTINPESVVSSITSSGRNVSITGNRAYPEMGFKVESSEVAARAPDEAIGQNLAKMQYQPLGLTPDFMDPANNSDFATSLKQGYLFLLRRIVQNQQDVEPFIKQLVTQLSVHSSIVMDGLSRIVLEHFKKDKKAITALKSHIEDTMKYTTRTDDKGKVDQSIDDDKLVDMVITEFLAGLTITLPRPDTEKLEDQLKEFQAASEAYKAVLDALITEEMFDATTQSQLSEAVASMKANLLALYQRDYIVKHGLFAELDVTRHLTGGDGELAEMMKRASDYTDTVLGASAEFLTNALEGVKKRKAREEAIAKAKEAAGVGGSDSSMPEDGGEADASGEEDDMGAGDDAEQSDDLGDDAADETGMDEDGADGGEEAGPDDGSDGTAEEGEGDETSETEDQDAATPEESDGEENPGAEEDEEDPNKTK